LNIRSCATLARNKLSFPQETHRLPEGHRRRPTSISANSAGGLRCESRANGLSPLGSYGPQKGAPALVPAGMMGDRADVIFASPHETGGGWCRGHAVECWRLGSGRA
jgi:hypothetical protein